MNEKGYTLLELIAVLIILLAIGLMLSPIILDIIDDAEENQRIKTVENYMEQVNNVIKIYMRENENVEIDNNLICSGSCNDKCLIDATKEAQKTGSISKTCTSAKKAILKSDEPIVTCNEIVYNQLESILEVSSCQIENDKKGTYSGNSKKGITNDISK